MSLAWTIYTHADSPTLLDNKSPFLPTLKEKPSRLSQLGEIFVAKIHITGNTIFSRKDLAFIIKPYENRIVTAEELHEIKNKLTLFYISKGYVNSGCVLEDQRIEECKIVYRIIEGILDNITVDGNKRLKDQFVANRLRLATGDGKLPFNINNLQTRLKILKQEPAIDNINTYVKPGLKKGEANLKVVIQEAKPYQITMDCHNHNSPGIGSYRGDLKFQHLNVLGWADTFMFKYGGTEGLNSVKARYDIPINRKDTRLFASVDYAETKVVAKSYSPHDITGDTTTFMFGLNHFLYRTPSTEFTLGLTFETRESHTELRGERFSFSDGVVEGTSKVSVIRCSQQWLSRSLNQVIAIHSSINMGLDLLDATIHDDESTPDGQYITWLGQFQWIRRLSFLNSQFISRLDIRVSDDPMLAIEKFSIGGAMTVRGYRENLIVSDSGFIGSVEWRIPIGTYPIPGLSKQSNDGQLVIAPFMDYGKGSNHNKDTELDPDQLLSAGLGFRWQIASSVFAEIYWGAALEDVEIEADADIQDDGLHFFMSFMF
ncbi:MAG: surface antigen D15 [Candidatus Magnetoglobus multicellularis str. Araruama]|uniref:Surface antigen D15 n=1 Tax=Candidatus Magnetoglobus multicellularis str. Araruama TaxID=890399 RepID=A0A1V1P8W6_9BACT|nr:MAG: surface antigen D15 [Candidatus Magnetoglobus multicellularis str. Araruama]